MLGQVFPVLGTPELHGEMLMSDEPRALQWCVGERRAMFAKVLAGTLMGRVFERTIARRGAP